MRIVPLQKSAATAEGASFIAALTNDFVPAMLYMKLPPADHSEIDRENRQRKLPWKQSVLVLKVVTPGDKIIYENSFWLGKLQWTYVKDRYWGWNVTSPLLDLEAVLRGLANYKIMATVQKPSIRSRDFVQLKSPEWNAWSMIEPIEFNPETSSQK
jgi:hypothetical protein